jgi:hypothetical protein
MTYAQLAFICIAPVVLLATVVSFFLYRGRKGRRHE